MQAALIRAAPYLNPCRDIAVGFFPFFFATRLNKEQERFLLYSDASEYLTTPPLLCFALLPAGFGSRCTQPKGPRNPPSEWTWSRSFNSWPLPHLHAHTDVISLPRSPLSVYQRKRIKAPCFSFQQNNQSGIQIIFHAAVSLTLLVLCEYRLPWTRCRGADLSPRWDHNPVSFPSSESKAQLTGQPSRCSRPRCPGSPSSLYYTSVTIQ